MKITFLTASSPRPIGGVIVQYELANSLARRGHEVHLAHGRFFGHGIDHVDELSWFDFEDGVRHHVDLPADRRDAPLRGWSSDVLIGSPTAELPGLPVMLVQGFQMLPAAIEREGLCAPSLKICVASWLVDVTRRFGVPDAQVAVVPPGIDHDVFRLIEPVEERDQTVAVLMHRHGAKGWDVAREVIARVRLERPNTRFLAFGTDDPRPGELPPGTDHIASPSHERLVEEVFNRSAILLQTSHHEGFGFTAVEAMACGCALVTTDNGGSRDYAAPGVGARVALPGDVGALARHVIELLDDPEQRAGLALHGKQLVERFRWDRTGEMFEAVLEAYVADPARFLLPLEPVPEGEESLERITATTILSETRTDAHLTPATP